MTSTYADITVHSVWDGDVVTERLAFTGQEGGRYVTLITATGGRRTEFAEFPTASLSGLRIADPTLVNVPQEALEYSANFYADLLRKEDLGIMPVEMTVLQGMAQELHRRRAVDCIERGCSKADAGCACHMLPAARRFRRK